MSRPIHHLKNHLVEFRNEINKIHKIHPIEREIDSLKHPACGVPLWIGEGWTNGAGGGIDSR